MRDNFVSQRSFVETALVGIRTASMGLWIITLLTYTFNLGSIFAIYYSGSFFRALFSSTGLISLLSALAATTTLSLYRSVPPRWGFIALILLGWTAFTVLCPAQYLPSSLWLYLIVVTLAWGTTASISLTLLSGGPLIFRALGGLGLTITIAAFILMSYLAINRPQLLETAVSSAKFTSPASVMRRLGVKSDSEGIVVTLQGIEGTGNSCNNGDSMCAVNLLGKEVNEIKSKLGLENAVWQRLIFSDGVVAYRTSIKPLAIILFEQEDIDMFVADTNKIDVEKLPLFSPE